MTSPIIFLDKINLNEKIKFKRKIDRESCTVKKIAMKKEFLTNFI